WNGEYCLEVMYEGDLDLDRASKVDFVRHHERMCNIDAKKCVYRGASDDSGGSEFIVSLASRHLKLNLPGLVETKDKGMRASSALYGAVGKLTRSCAGLNIATWGSISSTDPSAISLGRAVLNSIGNRAMQSDTANLACLFKSTDDLQLAISAAIDNVVGLPSDSGFFHELSQ
ncbi:hypothetical protein, partial [Haliangium sp. UPWRP_2]|uniref:hypothetical protein n=1 Tax=Haliangium sp. UPWRP_2 TaxID=1931276 RepID=UPI001E42D882